MQLKIKPVWIGLFLIAVMLFSTIAGAIIQWFRPQQNGQLPQSNIIDYPLQLNLRDALIQNGITIVTFDYNSACDNCIEQKLALEFYATEYKQVISNEGPIFSIYLEELLDNNLNKSKITIESAYGRDDLVNPNSSSIFNSLCKLMATPPIACALQKT